MNGPDVVDEDVSVRRRGDQRRHALGRRHVCGNAGNIGIGQYLPNLPHCTSTRALVLPLTTTAAPARASLSAVARPIRRWNR
jgi:hypothetical protein